MSELMKQRLMGIMMIIMGVLFTIYDGDGTFLIAIALPLGLAALFVNPEKWEDRYYGEETR